MKIYLASGYSVMNVKGRERELRDKFKPFRRLVSFFDVSRGNNIYATMGFDEIKRENEQKRNLDGNSAGRAGGKRE